MYNLRVSIAGIQTIALFVLTKKRVQFYIECLYGAAHYYSFIKYFVISLYFIKMFHVHFC